MFFFFFFFKQKTAYEMRISDWSSDVCSSDLKALWYLKTEGHMARFAVGHTVDIAARHYADIPSLRPLHEQTVADALEEVLAGPMILPPQDEDRLRGELASPDPDDGEIGRATCRERVCKYG